MASKGNGKSESPMTDYPTPPSPFSGSGSFSGHTAREFRKAKSSYGVIDVVQYSDDFRGGGGSVIEGSPMDEQITPSKPKGS